MDRNKLHPVTFFVLGEGLLKVAVALFGAACQLIVALDVAAEWGGVHVLGADILTICPASLSRCHIQRNLRQLRVTFQCRLNFVRTFDRVSRVLFELLMGVDYEGSENTGLVAQVDCSHENLLF